MFHFQVIDQQESEGQDREAKMLGDHKRALEELEEKLKKAESVKEKLEKSKEEAIQALNDKETPPITPSPQQSRNNR